MTVSLRRAQALGREAAYADALRLMDAVDTWSDFTEAMAMLRENKSLASETIKDLS